MRRKAEEAGSPERLRSAFLIAEGSEAHGEPPFRHSFLMMFPPHDQRALKLLAKLLYFKEDFNDEHFPVFRGSHNLAHLHAAAVDMLAIAQSLAYVADTIVEEVSQREIEVGKLADRYAVKAARLAREILEAMDRVIPPRRPGNPERLRRKAHGAKDAKPDPAS